MSSNLPQLRIRNEFEHSYNITTWSLPFPLPFTDAETLPDPRIQTLVATKPTSKIWSRMKESDITIYRSVRLMSLFYHSHLIKPSS